MDAQARRLDLISPWGDPRQSYQRPRPVFLSSHPRRQSTRFCGRSERGAATRGRNSSLTSDLGWSRPSRV